jgi:hypothetical protein
MDRRNQFVIHTKSEYKGSATNLRFPHERVFVYVWLLLAGHVVTCELFFGAFSRQSGFGRRAAACMAYDRHSRLIGCTAAAIALELASQEAAFQDGFAQAGAGLAV